MPSGITGCRPNLKLSVHSGSDKFSIYAADPPRDAKPARAAPEDRGHHLAGRVDRPGRGRRRGLALVKEIYAEAYANRDELCAPYAAVIDIDLASLPTPTEAERWTAEQWVGALRHDLASPNYNRSLRQLMHVAFKIAARMGPRYIAMLEQHEDIVAENVTRNLFDRHIRPVFLGNAAQTHVQAANVYEGVRS